MFENRPYMLSLSYDSPYLQPRQKNIYISKSISSSQSQLKIFAKSG